MITAATRLFVLLGNPVAHSLSPLFQNAAFEAAGCDGVYVAIRCDALQVAGAICAIAQAGGGGNVTIPHKASAAAAVEKRETVVTKTGACNTFWNDGQHVRGDNTDVAGFRAAVTDIVGSTRDLHALLVGAGGAARAAAYALLEDGGSIDVLSRTPARANELAARLDPELRRIRLLETAEAARARTYDLVINATPLGLLDDDPLAIDLERIAAPGALLDMVCRRGGTRLSKLAAARSIPSSDGHVMLIAQGAAAFERWWNVPAPIETMRAALGPMA